MQKSNGCCSLKIKEGSNQLVILARSMIETCKYKYTLLK